ncbi:hypothetical protein [Alteromonas sp. KUL42]|nr:hypothetical protein [Alteromonas sp. KUL42]
MTVNSQTLNLKPGAKVCIKSEIAAGTEPFRITLDESNVDRSIRLVD